MPRYRVVHKNLFSFEESVQKIDICCLLKPLETPEQSVEFSQIVILPMAASHTELQDDFGNHIGKYTVSRLMQSLNVEAIHTVHTQSRGDLSPENSLPLERVVIDKKHSQWTASLESDHFPLTRSSQQIHDYAMVSFTSDRPIIAAAYELMERIYSDFAYDTQATEVDTSAEEAFAGKKGVCQDFAHIAIACCHAVNIPARYVSGYLDTQKDKSGKMRRVAKDFSHAWFSVYDDILGWVDFDPTNNRLVDERYITLAYGRDYMDVAPLTGKFDPPCESSLKVKVDVQKLE